MAKIKNQFEDMKTRKEEAFDDAVSYLKYTLRVEQGIDVTKNFAKEIVATIIDFGNEYVVSNACEWLYRNVTPDGAFQDLRAKEKDIERFRKSMEMFTENMED